MALIRAGALSPRKKSTSGPVVGKIDQNIAFELFGKHAEEMCAAASRALDTEPYAEITIITADDRF
jgi:hypothetical protein